MLLLLFFVLPLVAVAAAWWWSAQRGAHPERGVLLAALVPAIVSSAGVVFIVSGSGHWRGGRELAWIANESTQPANVLTLGGERAGTTLGWPTGFSWPQVVLTDAGGAVQVQVRGGGGIVVVDGAPVNGTVLGTTLVAIRDFRVGVRHDWKRSRWFEIRAASAVTPPPAGTWWERWLASLWPAGADPALVAFQLPVPRSNVLTVAGRTARTVLELRRRNSGDDLALALALEQWAAGIKLYVTDAEVRLVDDADTTTLASKTTTGSSASLNVHWPRRVLRGSVGQSGSRLQLRFAPPWTQVSPLPPRPNPNDSVLLTLTNVPQPGDVVFDLPFGSERTVRESTRLLYDASRGDIFQNEAGWTRKIVTPPGVSAEPQLRTYGVERVRSDTCVTVGESRPCLAIVDDVLARSPLVAVIVIAVVTFAIGLVLAEPLISSVPSLGWTLALLLSAFWNVLALRLLLALRYALDPAGLDALAVGGVVKAVVALVAVPASLAAAVAVYREKFQTRDRPARRARFALASTVLPTMLVMAFGSGRLALSLWPNLPDRFRPGLADGGTLLLVLIAAFGVAAIIFSIAFDPTVRARRVMWERLLNLPLWFMTAAGRMWRNEQALDAPGFVRYWIPKGVLFAIVLAGFAAAARGGSGLKLVTEILYPVGIGVGCVTFWLGVLHAYPPGANLARTPLPRWKSLIGTTLLFAVMPGVAPIFFGDPGALYSMLGLLLVTGVVLAISRHSRFGYGVLVACLLVIVSLTVVTNRVSLIPGTFIGLFDRGAARMTAYMYGSEVQRMLPLARAQANTGDGLPADALRGALEHPWESAAIVYRGGWDGAGFGAAPTRRSNVPQEVLQYDSTMPFFIAGDHGLVGMFAVFALYLVPLAALLPGARRHFDTGYGLAVIATAWMVLEAVIHTTVNLGVLPFTGRNLPWLSVMSSSDLLRWTLMCFVIIHAVLWRSTGSEFLFSQSVEPIVDSGPRVPAIQGGAAPQPRRFGRRRFDVRSGLQAMRVPRFAAPAIAVALLVVALVVAPAIATVRDGTYAEPFTWADYFDELQSYLDSHRVRWDATTWTLDPSPLRDEGLELRGTSLLEQEIARFNALPRDAKSDLPLSLRGDLQRVRSVGDYDRVLLTAAARDRSRTSQPVTLFRVDERTTLLDNGTARTEYFPVVDRSLDASVSFSEDTDAQALPTVRYRPSAAGQPGPVIVGPAWVSGRWRTAFDADQRLPWAAGLASATQSLWNNRSYDGIRDRFSSITLDPTLQQQAVAFVAERGRQRHQEVLQFGVQASMPTAALPPRVALSVMALPTGEVLALGGWPAMSASNTWRPTAEGVLPPASWLETRAPRALSYRYVGERNFDPIEMGSATKPLWAAVALRIHPALPRALRTRGPEEDEVEVFGIRITADGWTTHARDWTPFRTYMSASDNRYQVRLGFLALAEGANGLPVADDKTGSTRESITMRNGAEVPWGRAPRFDPAIGFSRAAPFELHDVQNTRAAAELRQLFGISVRTGDYRPLRRSFWSLDESDDRVAGRRSLPAAFGALSPVVPAWRLELLAAPRDYVNLLLGGGTNRWANVDFGAAFGTVVTGHPVIAHIVPGTVTVNAQERVSFESTAGQLRDALRDVVSNGTATGAFGATAAWFRGRGVSVYAKTGTLSTDKGRTETSRLVVALVRWRNEARGEVAGGVVLSLVAERADVGFAAQWLNQFVSAHRDALLRHVQAPALP